MFAVTLLIFCVNRALSDPTAYFVDGWHGGVWGHYPPWVTQFLVDQMKRYPQWKINLEIEPETWDWVEANTPDAYKAFVALAADQSVAGRVEFINPDFAQSYLWNVTGESVVRQFDYGMRKIRQHFPNADFSVYSSEEPCFTSALPGILKSFGFKYAALKNPNTCWGGYTRAFGGELVNWVGPDGTRITAVPRYATEQLSPTTTWKTIASDNAPNYIKAAFDAGIAHPVGMCLQDAGWVHGPRLGKDAYQPTEYVTWRDYFENRAIQNPTQDWQFSQEDVQVSLVWGSQVLQRIAQEVRSSENKIIMAEKLAAMAGNYTAAAWPKSSFDAAWRTLLLSEHHDCWIVPYNVNRAGDSAAPTALGLRNKGGTSWAEKIARWTENTRQVSDAVAKQSMAALSGGAPSGAGSGRTSVRVFNTVGVERKEPAIAALPDGWTPQQVRVLDDNDREVPSQVVARADAGGADVVFAADVPSMGYGTYYLDKTRASPSSGASVSIEADGTYKIETDLYTLELDPLQGGAIRSLRAKGLYNKEFVDGANARRFGEIRGYFFEQQKYLSSADHPAKLTILENGPVEARVQTQGFIGIHPFTQVITVAQGDSKIDFHLRIDWQGSPGIGADYAQTVAWKKEDNQKAFYDDRGKLQVLFPLKLEAQKIYKNAPFDVTESKLTDTFFTRWDGIKNNIILNWVDATDGVHANGMALFTDHTTSYEHGADYPLGLTLQYSGVGLWGRQYDITGPADVHYAVVPHAGTWDQAGIWTRSDCWNEPLSTTIGAANSLLSHGRKSLISVVGGGYEICAMMRDGNDLLVRIFNAAGGSMPHQIVLDGRADSVEAVELNGDKIGEVPTHEQGGQLIATLALPKMKVQTLRFVNCSSLPH